MSKRLVGVLVLLMLALTAVAGPAAAVEGAGAGELLEEEPRPTSVDEVVADNDIAQQFVPEPYEQPSWFPLLQVPLLIVGVLVALALLFAFLLWQPHFARERQEKSRRR